MQSSKSNLDPVVAMKFEFCAHTARLLRKLDQQYWTVTVQCSIEKSKENVLPLHFAPSQASAQAKIQMLTTICSIVKLIPRNEVNLSHLYQHYCW